MLRYWSTICLFFVSNLLFAQKQITNFDFIKTVTPDRIEVLASLNDQILFKAYTKEGNNLWRSDGTKEGTEILSHPELDLDAYNIYSQIKIEKDSLNLVLFISNNQVYKSDGKHLEIILPKSDLQRGLFELFEYENEAFLTYLEPGLNGYSRSIYKLNIESNSLSLFEDNVDSYLKKDNKLFLAETSPDNLKSIIKYDGEERNEIISFEGENRYSMSLDVQVIYEKEYILIKTNTYQLVKIDESDTTQYTLLNLGHSAFHQLWIDENDIAYIAENNFDTLKISKINPNHSISLIIKESYKNLTRPLDDLSNNIGGGFLLNAAAFYENKLIYSGYQLTAHGQIKHHHLMEYDLESRTIKKSKDLGGAYTYTSSETISRLDSNIYQSESQTKIIVYDFNEMAIISSEEKWYPSVTSKDSVYQFPKKQIIVSDNIYSLNGFEKTPLMPSDTLFYEGDNQKQGFGNAKWGENTFMWLNNDLANTSELWVIDSQQKTSKLNDFQGKITHWKSGKDLAYFILETADKLNSKFYQTDGTREGTKLGFEITASILIATNKIETNDIGALFELYIDEKKAFLIYDQEWAYYPDLPPARHGYATYKTDLHFFLVPTNGSYYIENKLYQFKKGKLNKLLDNSSYIVTYKNKLYFSGYKIPEATQGLFVLNENLKIQTIVSDGYINFWIQDRWLIYRRTIVDLETGEVFDQLKFILEKSKIRDYIVIKMENGLAIITHNETIIFDGKGFNRIETPNSDINTHVRLMRNGIMYGTFPEDNRSTFYYLDFKSKKVSEVLPSSISGIIYSSPDLDYAFLDQLVDGDHIIYYWSAGAKQLVKIQEKYIGINYADNNNLILQANNEMYHWQYDGEKLNFVQKLTERPTVIDSVLYLLPGQGQYEVAFLKDDSFENYEELISGETRVKINSLFHHQGGLYGYGSTNFTGPQVWYVGEMGTKYEYQSETILSNSNPEKQSIVYPNPTSDFVKTETNQFKKYAIYNSVGILLKEGSIKPSREIPLTNLPSGNYFIVLSNSTERITKRIFKN